MVNPQTRRMGVAVGVRYGRLNELGALAARLEAQGLGDLWIEESAGHGAFATAALCAATTSKVRIGTGIVPVFGRSPAVIAMEAATLQAACGRFALGLGSSTKTIATDWRGEPFTKPFTRLVEYARTIRALLAGETVDHDGATVTLRRARVNVPLEDPPPIFFGALGEKALAAARELADGVVLSLVTPARVAEISRDAADVDRPFEIIARLIYVHAADPEDPAARERARREVAPYLTADRYRASLARQGFDDAIAAFEQRRERDGLKRALSGVDDALVDALAVVGPPETLIARREALWHAGAHTVFVCHPATDALSLEALVERTLESRVP
jgi:5,10-methylenetetrahydromethanopterin reductase